MPSALNSRSQRQGLTSLVDRHHRLWIAFLSALLLSGCWPRSTPETVKIGLVAPFEGRYRYIGYDAIYAARLAVREINEAGGVSGWRIELVAYDDRGDVDLALRTAGNLIVDLDVVAAIGHYRPETTDAAGSAYAGSDLPVVAIGGWSTASDHARHLVPSPDIYAQAMVAMGGNLVVSSTGVVGQGILAEALLTADVPEMVAMIPSDELAQVYTVLSPIQSGEWLVAWRAKGWNGSFVGDFGLAAQAFDRIAGKDALDTRFVTPYPLPQDLQGTEAWIAEYRSMGPHVPDPGPYALPTYEAVHLISDAIGGLLREGQSPDRETVGKALQVTRRSGRLGTIDWDDQGYWHEAPLYLYRWTDRGPSLAGQIP